MKAARSRSLCPDMMLLTVMSITITSILCLMPVLDARCHKANCLQCEHGTCTKCLYGWYGEDCSLTCVSCQSDWCEQFTGRCIQCSPGFYGDSCNITCPMNCLESYTGVTFCNRSTGLCLEGCEKSFWGSQCDKHCSKNCLKSVCEQRTGQCLHGCYDGFYGIECNKHCPDKCNTKCSYLLGNCFSCKHGFCGRHCNITNDHCKVEECRYNELDETISCVHGCKDGWTYENCSVRCSERCKDQRCEKDGNCTACPEDYSGDDCTNTVTKRQRINDVRDGLVTPRKYASLACRNDGHRCYEFLLALVVMKLLVQTRFWPF